MRDAIVYQGNIYSAPSRYLDIYSEALSALAIYDVKCHYERIYYIS